MLIIFLVFITCYTFYYNCNIGRELSSNDENNSITDITQTTIWWFLLHTNKHAFHFIVKLAQCLWGIFECNAKYNSDNWNPQYIEIFPKKDVIIIIKLLMMMSVAYSCWLHAIKLVEIYAWNVIHIYILNDNPAQTESVAKTATLWVSCEHFLIIKIGRG